MRQVNGSYIIREIANARKYICWRMDDFDWKLLCGQYVNSLSFMWLSVLDKKTMKQPRDMTLQEIGHLFNVHEFPSDAERENALRCFNAILSITEFIEERIAATPTLPCRCDYCDEIRNKKVRPKTEPKEKEPAITFSLD